MTLFLHLFCFCIAVSAFGCIFLFVLLSGIQELVFWYCVRISNSSVQTIVNETFGNDSQTQKEKKNHQIGFKIMRLNEQSSKLLICLVLLTAFTPLTF